MVESRICHGKEDYRETSLMLVNSFEGTNHLTAIKQEVVYNFKLVFIPHSTFPLSTLRRCSFSLAGSLKPPK